LPVLLTSESVDGLPQAGFAAKARNIGVCCHSFKRHAELTSAKPDIPGIECAPLFAMRDAGMVHA
jgi:hypothetical protein